MHNIGILLLMVLWVGSTAALELNNPQVNKDMLLVYYNGPLETNTWILFHKVELLRYSKCNFTRVSAGVYRGLEKLKKMMVKDCTYGMIDENAMEGAGSALEEVVFQSNTMEKFPLSNFQKLPNLKKLTVTKLSNAQKVIESNEMKGYASLEYFDFSANGLERIEDGAFQDLDTLKLLILNSNKFTSIPKEALVPLKSLHTLRFRSNLLKKFDSDCLPMLPELELLDLSKNSLKTLDLNGIKKVAPNLKTVVAYGTTIPDSELKEMSEKEGIKILYSS